MRATAVGPVPGPGGSKPSSPWPPTSSTRTCTVRGIEEAKAAYETTEVREKLARYHADNVDWAFWSWCNVWLSPEFRDWNVERFLPGITVPVLVLQGEDDHYGTVAQVDAIAEQVSGPAEKAIIANCGHSPYLEQPDDTLDVMVAFIERFVTGRTRD